MHINTTILRQQRMNKLQPLVHHRQVGRNPPLPGVAVSDLFEDRLGFRGRFPANFNGVAEVGSDGEGRVDVDEFEAAFGFDLFAQGAVGEAGKNKFVVASDQFVVPTLALPAFEVKHTEAGSFRSGFPSRLVDVLDVMKGQHGAGDGLVSSVPE
jgi:hypothetical protein